VPGEHHGVRARPFLLHQLLVDQALAGRDQAYVPPQLTQIDPAESVAEHGHRTHGGVTHRGGQRQQRRLARAVRTENGPVVAVAHPPVDPVQQRLADDPDPYAFEFKHVHPATLASPGGCIRPPGQARRIDRYAASWALVRSVR
jgi:hypothetical protein